MKQKDVVIVNDPKLIKVITESTRSKILSLLRINNLSISQLSELIGKDQSTIYRHIKKLESSGIVVPVGERKVHHIPEVVYGRVAKTYIIVPEIESDRPSTVVYYKRETIKNVMSILEAMGYSIDSPRVVSRDLYRFSKELDLMSVEDWKKIEKKNIKMDNRTFINTVIVLSLLKINSNPVLKDYMEELHELIRRKK